MVAPQLTLAEVPPPLVAGQGGGGGVGGAALPDAVQRRPAREAPHRPIAPLPPPPAAPAAAPPPPPPRPRRRPAAPAAPPRRAARPPAPAPPRHRHPLRMPALYLAPPPAPFPAAGGFVRAAAIELQRAAAACARTLALFQRVGWGLSGEAESEGGPLSPAAAAVAAMAAAGPTLLRLLEALLDFVRRADAPGGGDTARRRALLRELSALRLVMALLEERVPLRSASDAAALTPSQAAVATRCYALLAAACRRDAANARHAAQWLGRLVAHLPLRVGADTALAAIATSSLALRDGLRAAAHALVAALTPTSLAEARQPQALQRLRLLHTSVRLTSRRQAAQAGAAGSTDEGGGWPAG